MLGDEPLRVLLRALRIGLVEPDDLDGPAEQHVGALFKREQAALREILGLFGDLPGLGPEESDLDRLGGVAATDERRGDAGRRQTCAPEEQLAAVDCEILFHAFLPDFLTEWRARRGRRAPSWAAH